MTHARDATCPECGGPLVRGTFCRECGWDGEVMSASEDEEYLADVDLPQGYSQGEDPEGFDYEETLRREGLLPPSDDEAGRGGVAPAIWSIGLFHAMVGLIVVAFVVLAVVLSGR